MRILTQRCKIIYNKSADRFYIYISKKYNDILKKLTSRNVLVTIEILDN